ncbi:hypothetical protein BDC45DRAFT_605010 [Circinella umbellata]|nr:hypothetical protein BDC45DRAFT_605010 [Circinella umbellata]
MTSWLNNINDINLRESIQQLISIYPDSLSVVQNLINYYNDKLTSNMQQENGREHNNKKRKLDSPSTTLNEKEEQKTISINDISFQLPARKKLNMIFTSTRRLYLVNTKTEEMDFTFDLNELEQVCCVPSPVPTKGHTFTLFFKQQPMDPIVFTIQQKGDIHILRPQQQQQPSILTEDKEKHIIQILSEQTQHDIQLPSKSIYLSTVLSTTTGKRPDEDRFYANVYLKNKEACLYFLPKGILFGFKKPVYYFPLTILSSTYYSGITQHTFNLTLVLKKNQLPLGSLFNGSKDEQENGSTLEFSMIEQSEFGGIDQYIKKMNINDKSMSEENMAPETKAKKQQQQEEEEEEKDDDGNTRTISHNNNNEEDDDDEENDDDFEPSDDDDEPLEYDTDAGSSQQESSDDDNDNEEEEEDDDEDDDMMDEDIRIETNKKRPLVDGIDEIDDSKDEGEQDITKTDNEEEEEEEGTELNEEEEEDEDEEEEELHEDNAESESLGSSSEDDIDEDMRDAKSRNIIPEDAKDELEDSD